MFGTMLGTFLYHHCNRRFASHPLSSIANDFRMPTTRCELELGITNAQKTAYIDAVMQQQLEQQLHQQVPKIKMEFVPTLKVPQVPHPSMNAQNPSEQQMFVVGDEGVSYDEGIRVLRSIGTWYVRLDKFMSADFLCL
ncbi:unnamed protein product [Nesidiocoris tenuis]|uniref:Uncharacterized protein n=1 Tax=Nesidiocoris tenuis TaxID=355587 RepID=A0A6H5G6J8_9HEMI|nr:unnamed protein product [Nesidiocoris tenuis]